MNSKLFLICFEIITLIFVIITIHDSEEFKNEEMNFIIFSIVVIMIFLNIATYFLTSFLNLVYRVCI